jgi:hypothetical protein
MNVERLAAIAEWLEAGAPERGGVGGFDMRYIDGSCGTPCCIAGAALQWWGNGRIGISAQLLDLRDQQWADLCMPAGFFYRDITASQAARCIRKLIATGEVDWAGTREASA